MENLVNFRITLCLEQFFDDYKSKSKLFITNKIKTINDLKLHISKVFNISDFHLTSDGCFLPESESIKILQTEDNITVIPNQIIEANICENVKSKKKKRKRKNDCDESACVSTKIYKCNAEENETNAMNRIASSTMIMDELRDVIDTNIKSKRTSSKELEDKINYYESLQNEANEQANSFILNKSKEYEARDNIDKATPKKVGKICEKKRIITPLTVLEKTNNIVKTIIIKNGNGKAVEIENKPIESFNIEKPVNENTSVIVQPESTVENNKSNEIMNDSYNEVFESDHKEESQLDDINVARGEKEPQLSNGIENKHTESVPKWRPYVNRLFSIGALTESLKSQESDDVKSETSIASAKKKRTRVRKRKRPIEDPFVVVVEEKKEIEYIPPNTKAKPTLHIRFDDGEEANNKTHNQTMDIDEIETIKTESDVECSKICNNITFRNEPIETITKIDEAFVKENEETQITEPVAECNSINGDKQNITVLDSTTITSCKQLFTPKEKDILIFKILKLNENYMPVVSESVIGSVLNYNQDTDDVELDITGGKNEFLIPNGKFTVEAEMPNNANKKLIKTINWKQLIEPRLIYL